MEKNQGQSNWLSKDDEHSHCFHGLSLSELYNLLYPHKVRYHFHNAPNLSDSVIYFPPLGCCVPQCSITCGHGVQTRLVTCSSNEVLGDTNCPANTRPDTEEGCDLGPCENVEWLVSEWTDVSYQVSCFVPM